MVLVKKAYEKFKMCVDYIYLTRACLKDSYPLLNIDKLVDNSSKYKLFLFMDVYFVYK